MKYVLALILSLLFTVTAYASPEIYSNGMYKEKIIYLGTMNKGTESGYYIYSTQESLEANYNKTNYHNYYQSLLEPFIWAFILPTSLVLTLPSPFTSAQANSCPDNVDIPLA